MADNDLHPKIQARLNALNNKAYTPAMKKRVGFVMTVGMNNDTALLEKLGNMEQYSWHEGRKIADPNHVNPYIMADRRRATNG